MLIIPLVIWLAAAALSGAGQGLLLPTFRRYVPQGGEEDKRIGRSLHLYLLLAYALPVALAWQTWPAMVLGRVVAFNIVLNYCAGKPAFDVGQTALWDRTLRRLAPARPERLAFLLWLAAILAAAGFYFTRL